MEKELYKLLERGSHWDAARALAARYFGSPGDKFVTEFKQDHRWIVAQWVTTSSSALSTVPLVFPGRVGIGRRRKTAFRHMVEGHWLLEEPEPEGFTLVVSFIRRMGNRC